MFLADGATVSFRKPVELEEKHHATRLAEAELRKKSLDSDDLFGIIVDASLQYRCLCAHFDESLTIV